MAFIAVAMMLATLAVAPALAVTGAEGAVPNHAAGPSRSIAAGLSSVASSSSDFQIDIPSENEEVYGSMSVKLT